ncbi:acyltransferase family protein [Streptococcus phocae]|uniref:Acyltransferase 3 domain-containing protein n=1 Tax=Streptococcus phocae TaxID=119224 RepID=A0A0P6SEJ7_9STRE|nr:acyltransferase [Streptococcus phocae]KPJ22656.1 hypothetical protein AKK44_03105 [Streptococcus phocae]
MTETSKAVECPLNYQVVSLLQFLFSIFVIVIHSGRLVENEIAHFVLKSGLGRMAVPYFLVSSSFFISAYGKDIIRLRRYTKRLMKRYVFWSLLYLPYAYWYFLQLKLSQWYLLPALLIGFFYTGMCYHLWYVPAMITGWLLVSWLKKRCGKWWTLVIVMVLYGLGAFETYSAFIEHSLLSDYFSAYLSIFQTTRHGLFYTPAYIYIGMLLYEHFSSKRLAEKGQTYLLVALGCLVLENSLIFFNQGHDKNFFLASVPFTVLLVKYSLRTRWLKGYDLSKLKELSLYYYVIHPIFIELFLLILSPYGFSNHIRGSFLFVMTLMATHMTSCLLISGRAYFAKR